MASIQMGGIASGLDTASMVEAMMAVQRAKVDRVFQQRVNTEWQQEALVSVSDKYANLVLNMRSNFGVTNNVSINGTTRPGTINNLSWVNKATSSNTNALTARATSSAARGKHELKVEQLASNVRTASTEAVPDGKNLGEQLGIKEGESVTFEINGKSVTASHDMTMSALVAEINKIDGVTASFDSSIGRFFLETDQTGEGNDLIITDAEGNSGAAQKIVSALKLNIEEEMEEIVGENGELVKQSTGKFVGLGKDAIVSFNGAENIKFSNNNFTIQGIEFSLQGVSGPGEVITVTVDTDVDSVFDKVMSFVNEYNDMMLEINSLLNEKVNRNYPPLTDDQRKDMTEKEIELWEEEAKKGVIRNDSTVSSIQQQLRTSMIQSVTLSDGSTMSLHNIGIQGVSLPSPTTSGTLQVDEEKLRAAIAENPEGVLELFFAVPNDSNLQASDRNLTSAQITEKRAQSGIFNRMTDIISSGISQITTRAGVGDSANSYRQVNSFIMTDFAARGSRGLLDERIAQFNKQITTLNTRLATVEARYWKQFTAMETALASLQSQSGSLASFWS